MGKAEYIQKRMQIVRKKKKEEKEEEEVKDKKGKEMKKKEEPKKKKEYKLISLLPTFHQFKPQKINIKHFEVPHHIEHKKYKLLKIDMLDFTEIKEMQLDNIYRELPKIKSTPKYKYPVLLPEFEEIKKVKLDNVETKIPEVRSEMRYTFVYVLPEFGTYLEEKLSKRIRLELDTKLPEDVMYFKIRDVINLRYSDVEIGGNGGGAEMKEVDEYFEEKKIFLDGARLAISDRPKVVIIKDDKFKEITLIFLKELYRIKSGGTPKSMYYSILAPPFYSAVEDLSADKTIFVLDRSFWDSLKEKDENKIEEYKNMAEEMLYSKIMSIYAQSSGFLVVIPNEDLLKTLKGEEIDSKKYYGKILERFAYTIREGNWEIIEVPNDEESKEKLEKDIPIIFGLKYTERLYNIFRTEAEYQRYLEDLSSDPEVSFYVKTGENESFTHYALKVFTVKYLIKNGKMSYGGEKTSLDLKNIKVEEPIDDYIPDIYIAERVYEIETLYGRAFSILNNLYEKVRKARDHGIKEIHFVFAPIGFYLFKTKIMKALKNIKEMFPEMRIYVELPIFDKENFVTKEIIATKK